MFDFTKRFPNASNLPPRVLVALVMLGIACIIWLSQSSNILPFTAPQSSKDYKVRAPISKLVSLHRAYTPLSADSWNPKTPQENQHPTFDPRELATTDSSRDTIYILPIGQISRSWFAIIKSTATLVSRLFCVEVIGLESVSGLDIPEEATRRTPVAGTQLHSVYLTDQYLAKKVPDNAIALVAFSSFDLWPGGKSHYAIAHSNYAKRTAVWSLYRIGRPSTSEANYQHALRRTLKLAAHEIGHFVGLDHATDHFGLMNGFNSLREAEAQPLFLSPQSLQYVMDRFDCSLKERFEQLRKFYVQNQMPSHGRMMYSSLKALE
jgi:archaemetzincin